MDNTLEEVVALSWQFNRTEAVFLQIEKRLKREILVGKYPPDSQFPSVRQLAAEVAVNPNTMQKALLLLENEGLLYSKGTLGRFVTSDAQTLRNAKDEMQKEVVTTLLAQARELGISGKELIEYIEMEEDQNG